MLNVFFFAKNLKWIDIVPASAHDKRVTASVVLNHHHAFLLIQRLSDVDLGGHLGEVGDWERVNMSWGCTVGEPGRVAGNYFCKESGLIQNRKQKNCY